jgi:hypothetical protein
MEPTRLTYTHLDDEARVLRQAMEVIYRRAHRGDLTARQSNALDRAGKYLELAKMELARADRPGEDG